MHLGFKRGAIASHDNIRITFAVGVLRGQVATLDHFDKHVVRRAAVERKRAADGRVFTLAVGLADGAEQPAAVVVAMQASANLRLIFVQARKLERGEPILALVVAQIPLRLWR